MIMNNPTEPGFYTTIFKDGSIIHYNEWMMFDDGHGKWYWNSTANGGIIHWFKPSEDYQFHNFYKIPDWELREILNLALKYEALNFYNLVNKNALDSYLIKEGFPSYEEFVDNELDTYYKGYIAKGGY